ncbi:MAG: AAA family ATPase [Polyangiales bacterium]
MKTFDERRVATVLFVDMCGYSAFIGDEDPEDVARVLEQLKETASGVVEACGGIVNQFVGDEIVALFGVRQSHEDDARRAVTAALMLHERARNMGLRGARSHRPCLLHSGIETGLVLARARDIRAGVYDVIGEPVNLAARLRSQAGPDEILLGPRTLSQVGPYFDVEPVESFVPRGMSQVVQPARVLKPTTAQNAFDTALRRGLTDYVGREPELARVMALAHAVERGEGACLAVAGSPGMGKTRLFYEARKRVRSVLARMPAVLVGRCSALAEAPAYHPFVDALQKLIEELADDQDVSALLGYGEELAPHLPVFAYLLGRDNSELALSGERLREAIVDALASLLSALSRERLTLVMLEDWHWADEASSAALRQLVARAQQRVLFAVNYRSAELPADSLASTLSLELTPLDRAETAEMAALALDAAYVPDELVTHIHDTTQGNPFFIEETCRSLVETGAIAQRGAGVLLTCPVAQLTTPNSVQAMVRARIDRLRPADKELLRLASVLGTEFSEDLLLILARASDRLGDYAQGEHAELIARLERQLAQLELSGLVYRAHKGDSARFRFKHAITREVAYADLPRDERRAHHERIGRAIEQRQPLAPWYDQLAHHFGASPSLDKAVLYAERAADHALRAFSLQRAMRHYRSAIEGIDQSAPITREKQKRRVQLSLKWASCCVVNPAREQLGVLEQSLHWARQLDDPRAAVRCLSWMAWLAHVVGDQQRAVELYQTALAESAKLRDDLFGAHIRGNIGLSYAMAARHDEAQTALQSNLGSRQRASALVGGGYGYTLAYLGLIAGDQGEFERAHQYFERALSTVQDTGRMALLGAVLTMRAMVEGWQRDFSACQRTAAQVRDIADRVSGGYLRAMSDTLAGAARVFGQNEPAGLDALQASVRWLDMHRIHLTMSWNEAWLAEALARNGQFHEAEAAASRALVRSTSWDALGEVQARRVRALVYLERDRDPFRAERELQFAHDAAERKRGRRDLALTTLARASLRARQGGPKQPVQDAQRALTALGVRVDPSSDWFG